KKGKKGKGESPAPAATPAPAMVAQKPAAPTGTPFTIAAMRALPPNAASNPAVSPPPAGTAPVAGSPPAAQAAPVPTITPVPVLPPSLLPPILPTSLLPQTRAAAVGKHFHPARCRLAVSSERTIYGMSLST